MTAPDPGLTDLIAAALYSVLAKSAKSGTATVDDFVASVTPVVEQHNNGRIAETVKSTGQRMYAQTKKWQERAENAEATIVRVQNALEGVCDSCDYTDLRAALEGEQQ